MFENLSESNKRSPTEAFQALAQDLENKSLEQEAFNNLENTLLENGFSLAGSVEADEVLHSGALFCRSEQFTKVLNLVEFDEVIEINNTKDSVNMCTVSSGRGLKTAMLEGFSGKNVGGLVKVVMTFQGEHLHEDTHSVPKDSDLWRTKPETAAVSLIGRGEVRKGDIKMLSFRFPISHFPERLLTEEEQEGLEELKIQFVVRHYVPNKKTASSQIN